MRPVAPTAASPTAALLLAPLLLAPLLLACPAPPPAPDGASSPSQPEAEPPAAPPSPRHVDPSLAKDPCKLLTPATVAAVAEAQGAVVSVEALRTMRPMTNMCSYRWGSGEATIGFVVVEADPAAARKHLEDERAQPGANFEDEPKLGDAALFDTTLHRLNAAGGHSTQTPANRVHVVVANLYFRATMRLGEDPAANRAATLALARAVVDEL